jgi:hypothetical protein
MLIQFEIFAFAGDMALALFDLWRQLLPLHSALLFSS